MEPTATSPSNFTQGVLTTRHRFRFFGLTVEDLIRVFFGGNATVAIVVLALITVFLLREGAGFFGQNRENLRIYRQAGLEYVDFIRRQVDGHTTLTRELSALRLRQFQTSVAAGRSPAEANAALKAFDAFSDQFSDAIVPLRRMLSELTSGPDGDGGATAIKTKFLVAADKRVERDQLLAAGKEAEAARVKIEEIDFARELEPLLATRPAYENTSRELAAAVTVLLPAIPAVTDPGAAAAIAKFRSDATAYLAGFPAIAQGLATWDYTKPVGLSEAFTAFLFGRQWLTASLWQDWYGIVPLLVGSLMVSIVALLLAVPFGVGAAIYINQVATPREQRWVKPAIEFIAAIPSVVLGFFGIAVLGELLRQLSGVSWLSWVPGFPFSERLNILTAGCLLALISVPTIFTLAEDALNNVPRAFKEASFALGANRLQTILRIIVPAALSGIVSAVLLGLGRVIGETMIVLLCAGNRIAIPDFTAGLGVVTQPTHTMTGIIAQEMGEVAVGSIHYRALFVVGLVLFLLSLAINYAAQHIVRRYRVSIG
jgi:phosphate transport system permease protein